MFYQEIDEAQKKKLISLAGERAGNFFDAHGLCCSEAVVTMLNQGFDGGLEPSMAANLSAGFCGGMGGAGCVCGALSGVIMGLGLFLGPRVSGGMRKKDFRKLTKTMHDRFKERFSATCCRVLTKKVKHDKKAHFENCKMLTIGAAELAVDELLNARPCLAAIADLDFLSKRESKMQARAKKFFGEI